MYKIKKRKSRVKSAIISQCKGKVGMYWWVVPLDKKDRTILSSVDCVYNQEYYSHEEAAYMLRSL